MKQVRYLKSTHDAHAGEKRFLRDDHAEVLRLTGHVEFIDIVEKKAKNQKRIDAQERLPMFGFRKSLR